MAFWRDKLDEVTYYDPDGSVARWNRVELCYDREAESFCIVTEVRARDGIIRHVSDEFAAAFVKEFGE